MRHRLVWMPLLGYLLSAPALAAPEIWPGAPSETLSDPPGCLETCGIDGKTADLRPDSLVPLWRDTTHFRVHYAVSGDDSIPAVLGLAYIDSLASSLERAYVCFRDTLGLPVALPDGTRGGGQDLIDWYVLRQRSGSLGSAAGDSCWLGGPCPRCTGYISVRNRAGWSLLRGTAAHEYFHLVQQGAEEPSQPRRQALASRSRREEDGDAIAHRGRRATKSGDASAAGPKGSGGDRPAASLRLLDDAPRHRLRRRASPPADRRSERG